MICRRLASFVIVSRSHDGKLLEPLFSRFEKKPSESLFKAYPTFY